MIFGSDIAAKTDLSKIVEPLNKLVDGISDVGDKLVSFGQEIAGTDGANAAAGNGQATDGQRSTVGSGPGGLPDPELPLAFSDFLTDKLVESGMFDGAKKDKMPEASAESEDDGSGDAEKIKDLSGDTAKAQTKADEEQAQSDKKLWASKLANAIAGSKKLAKVRKAYAIGAAVVNAAVGITQTFKTHGFPKAIPFAAALAAQAATQIATIKGQAHDGLDKVPSSGTYLLEKGERVVGKRLNQDLSNFLGTMVGVGGGAGSSISNLDRSTSTSSSFNPTINLTIGGDASPDAVSSNRGAIETMIREIYADYAQASPFSA